MEKICVILVNYNGQKYNDNCLASIFASTVADRIQVVIVDNGSTDGSLKSLQDTWGGEKRVHIIPLNVNSGFAKANNVGIRWAMEQGMNYYLLLNNDTEIAGDAIEQMWKCHKEKGCIVTPKIYYADQKDVLWSAGGRFTPVIKKPVQMGCNQKDFGEFSKNRDCDFANGCAVFLDRTILEKTGLLDESFFLYYEDTEFSMRAHKMGIPIYYCAQAKVYHKVNGSTKGNQSEANVYYITRNWLIYVKLHLGWRRILFWPYFILNRLVWGFLWLLQGKPQMIGAMCSGIKDYFVWRDRPEEYHDQYICHRDDDR